MMTSKQKTKSLVNKATTNDRNPPSGYLLKELTSRTSSISECQTMEDLLLKKLSKNKAYIKYKALRIIKHLSENGSLNWCRAWQRNKNKLIEAQQFHGPRDLIYGDAPYAQVRKAAKDTLQSVFQQKSSHSQYIPNINRYSDEKKAKIKTKIKKSSGKYEKQWVHNIVHSAGIGWKIPDLSKYVKQFDNLSKDRVLNELNKTLTHSMWQKQAKSLVFIEGLMNGKSSNYVINYFNISSDNIQSLQNANKSILRRKANAIIEYLDIEQDLQQKEKQKQNENESEKQENTPQFIDLFETEEDDMFSGMNVVKNEDFSKGDSSIFGLDNLDFSVALVFGTDLNITQPVITSTNITQPQQYQNNVNGMQINLQCIENNSYKPINDPFAEIMNGVSTQTQKNTAPDPFAEFAQFGVNSYNHNL